MATDEARAEHENRWGRSYDSGTFIPPEICAEGDVIDAEARDLIRQWCGKAAQERRDELVALREEVVRLGLLVERAVTALRSAGAENAARMLERDLGVPVESIRAYAEQDDR